MLNITTLELLIMKPYMVIEHAIIVIQNTYSAAPDTVLLQPPEELPVSWPAQSRQTHPLLSTLVT